MGTWLLMKMFSLRKTGMVLLMVGCVLRTKMVQTGHMIDLDRQIHFFQSPRAKKNSCGRMVRSLMLDDGRHDLKFFFLFKIFSRPWRTQLA